ncbi:hypothetical protein D3C76_1680890 [compost metagenome]
MGSLSTSCSMTLQLMHQSAYQSSSSGVLAAFASARAWSSSAGVLMVCHWPASGACGLPEALMTRGWPIGLKGSVWPLKAPYQQARP